MQLQIKVPIALFVPKKPMITPNKGTYATPSYKILPNSSFFWKFLGVLIWSDHYTMKSESRNAVFEKSFLPVNSF